MNLGDGLLFELENGKPRLILLAHAGVGKNPSKLPSKHRAANILSAKQPSCVEEVQPEERPPQRSQRLKAGRAALSCSSSVNTSDGRATVLPSSKAQGHHTERGSRAAAKVKTNKHKLSTGVGPQGGSGRAGPPPNPEDGGGRRAGQKLVLTGVDAGLKDSVVCLTRDQLHQILSSIQTAGHGQPGPQEQTAQGGQPDTNPVSSVNGGEEREVKEDDKGEAEGRADDACGRFPRSSFTWLQELQSDSRAALNAKKAQWKRELAMPHADNACGDSGKEKLLETGRSLHTAKRQLKCSRTRPSQDRRGFEKTQRRWSRSTFCLQDSDASHSTQFY